MSNPERRTSTTTVALWCGAALLAGGIVALAVLRPAAVPPAAPPEKDTPVRVITVAPTTVADALEIPGRVAASADLTLSAETPGRVIELPVDKGDAVRKGQVLARLDARLWQAALDRARVEQRESARDLQRQEALRKTGAVADSDVDAARMRADLAAAQIAEAELRVEQCEIRGPADGWVEDRWMNVGERAGEGQRVLRLVVMEPLKVQIDVPEKDIAAVAPGLAVPCAAGALGGAAFTGTVAFVANQARQGSGTFLVELRVPRPLAGLRPGMVVDVSLPRPVRTDALVVPLHAVIPRKGDYIVFRVGAGERAESRVVHIERFSGDRAVLSSGIAAGDRIVVEGHRLLQDGVKVTPTATTE